MKCAACGKTGDSLKRCTACKSVRYCDVSCQKRHRKDHRKECKRRASELKAKDETASGLIAPSVSVPENLDDPDSDLWKRPPPRRECPICMLPLPIDPDESIYHTCCGKRMCGGCDLKNSMTIERDRLARGVDEPFTESCAFCREKDPDTETFLKRLKKRMEMNDSNAFICMAGCFKDGDGVPKDEQKEFEYTLRAAELGNAEAYYWLAVHCKYVERNEEKYKDYSLLAAMGGHLGARHNLGMSEYENGRKDLAVRHWRIAAGAGLELSLDAIKQVYKEGILSKDEFAETLRAFQAAQEEMKSKDREFFSAEGVKEAVYGN